MSREPRRRSLAIVAALILGAACAGTQPRDVPVGGRNGVPGTLTPPPAPGASPPGGG